MLHVQYYIYIKDYNFKEHKNIGNNVNMAYNKVYVCFKIKKNN